MTRRRTQQRILCLWFPNWPLQRMRLVHPALKRCELTLCTQQRGALRVVASDRYPTGTPRAEVMSGKVKLHDPLADQGALADLAAWCEQFSPVVGVEPPDCLCLDIAGLEHLTGNEERLVKRVVHSLRRRGLNVRAAVADTIGIAWGAVHYGPPSVTFVQGTTLFKSLPVEALRLDDETPILAELGVKSISQLLALPREALASRFGPQLLHRIHQALGEISEPLVSHRPQPEIQVEQRCEHPVHDRQALQMIIEQLLQRVAVELVQRQQGALEIRCELQGEHSTIAFTASLFRPSAHAAHLLELATMQLDRLELPSPIDCVKIGVLSQAPLVSWQQELFEESRREGGQRLGQLVDRLSNRLGREAVVRAVPQAEAQPELAIRYEPLAGAARPKSKRRFSPLPRPLRLELQPQPIEAWAAAPLGPPRQFRWHGEHRVRRAWGPERIQTSWWRGRYVQRDYYRVETAEGKRFWLFRELRSSNWFLHGAFD
ncbi:Y-family DNA polymerase [Lacipirellula sp.]|uniref:Y-family DNA polymerase n=1 Tax=Lacipirellula sp. TaxID=2691419 RepID=UPI003D0B6910